MRAARYPQVPGAGRLWPAGRTGLDCPPWRRILGDSRHKSTARQPTCEALDPEGELLLLGIVENVRGINNLPDILRQVKGIGAIWAAQETLRLHGTAWQLHIPM